MLLERIARLEMQVFGMNVSGGVTELGGMFRAKSRRRYQDMTDAVSDFSKYVKECGYNFVYNDQIHAELLRGIVQRGNSRYQVTFMIHESTIVAKINEDKYYDIHHNLDMELFVYKYLVRPFLNRTPNTMEEIDERVTEYLTQKNYRRRQHSAREIEYKDMSGKTRIYIIQHGDDARNIFFTFSTLDVQVFVYTVDDVMQAFRSFGI